MNPVLTVFYFKDIKEYGVVDLWCRFFGHGLTPNLAVEQALNHGISPEDIDLEEVF